MECRAGKIFYKNYIDRLHFSHLERIYILREYKNSAFVKTNNLTIRKLREYFTIHKGEFTMATIVKGLKSLFGKNTRSRQNFSGARPEHEIRKEVEQDLQKWRDRILFYGF